MQDCIAYSKFFLSIFLNRNYLYLQAIYDRRACAPNPMKLLSKRNRGAYSSTRLPPTQMKDSYLSFPGFAYNISNVFSHFNEKVLPK